MTKIKAEVEIEFCEYCRAIKGKAAIKGKDCNGNCKKEVQKYRKERKIMKKSYLINWEKVNYTVSPYDYPKIAMDLVKVKQPKAWELLFTLVYMLIIYTTFVISFSAFLVLSDLLILIPIVGIVMTMFMFGHDFIENFTWWVRTPVLIYMILIIAYLIFII